MTEWAMILAAIATVCIALIENAGNIISLIVNRAGPLIQSAARGYVGGPVVALDSITRRKSIVPTICIKAGTIPGPHLHPLVSPAILTGTRLG
jgi:hypothetical protein